MAKRKAPPERSDSRRYLYERLSEPLLPRREFLRRWLAHGGLAAGLVALALTIGILGYHGFARLAWIDSFLNAAMILSGMGPVDALPAPAAKLFAGAYALFSGLVILAVAGILLGPPVHRMLHRLHLDDPDDDARG